MVPKHKSRDAGSSSVPKRSQKALPLTEKVKVLNSKRKEKKSHVEVAKIYGKNKSFICEIVKKEKESCAGFAAASQTAKVTATVCDKGLVKMEKALNLCNILRERHSPNFYYSIFFCSILLLLLLISYCALFIN